MCVFCVCDVCVCVCVCACVCVRVCVCVCCSECLESFNSADFFRRGLGIGWGHRMDWFRWVFVVPRTAPIVGGDLIVGLCYGLQICCVAGVLAVGRFSGCTCSCDPRRGIICGCGWAGSERHLGVGRLRASVCPYMGI